jgi:cell division protein FtsQ
MFNSKFCNIEEVIIKGNNYLSENEIFAKSQIKLGKNIFKLDLNKVINSLKEEPWIRELEVKRVIPKKIIISLEERKAAAIV